MDDDLICMPRALINDVRKALNLAPNFKYPGKLKQKSYDLAAMLDQHVRFCDDRHIFGLNDDDIDHCRDCGTRTWIPHAVNSLGDRVAIDYLRWCPNCGAHYTVEQDND